ncbi:MAG: corrinoid protein [Eggerthellaceae bacterium]|nr:corrinoid protein [Eggerthellaceae bacterium]
MASIEDLAKAVFDGDSKKSKKLSQKLVDEGVAPLDVINQGLMGGMTEVGVQFKAGTMFVPDVMAAAEAMSAGVAIVKPLIAHEDMQSLGKVYMCTVKADLHDIGKNLVIMMLEGAGFEVINGGVDVAPEKIVEDVKELHPDIIGMSALLTTTMLHMKDTIELLKEEGLRDQVKVIIGGAPVSQDFADEIAADGYSPDAVSAADLAKSLVGAA